ncbi:MAG TPA: substrate-binding domain-containing protein [Ignavibacteriaceae bacterium]|nr:substrate-binding domain-containing protein [Ignavibacteriaceae bacterium]
MSLPKFNNLFTIILLAVLLFSCGEKKEKKGNSRIIGVTLLARQHIFYRDLEEGLNDEAGKNNYSLIITSADWDLGKQIAQIEDFISRKVDAIVVCPVDSKGIGSGIKEANNAGIPVFTADIAAQEGKVISHIASNNIEGGKKAAEYLAKLLNGKGKIAIINQPAITSVIDRVQGFTDELSKYPDIKIAADVNGQGVRDRALQVTADVLEANPKLNGIFGINDDSALGALDAVQQFNRKGIVIIGYDATPPAVDAILNNSPLKADVVQYPKKIGEKTIQAIKDYFAGKSVPPSIPVEVGIADKESLSKNKIN